MARGLPRMKMPSPMVGGHAFSQVPRAAIERSTFDRSHAYKTTFDEGLLIPFFLDEALPGDTFNVHVTALIRLATPYKPFMDNLWADFFFFFVPNRLVWVNWQKFNGEQLNPGDSTSFTVPITTVPAAGYSYGSLEDYFGFPVGIACTAASWTHSCLPIRAYKLIYNQWFRDENLIASATFSTGDGPDVPGAGGNIVFKRGKRHDYFTSCLPWPQKGTAVTIPLGSSAPVYVGSTLTAIGVGIAGATSTPKLLNNAGASNIQATAATGGTALTVDLTNAASATINSLRQAFQIQKMLERDARGGTRYVEILKAHFGVTSPDARLQRPEYLGGGTLPVEVTPIPQTTQTGVTGGTTVLGNLAGAGAAIGGGIGFTKSFVEHGIVIGMVNIRADLTYWQGIDRSWLRVTRFDYFWPALAHIGEQAVLTNEINVTDNWTANNTVFGYQERYGDYRYKQSRITGKFRSNVAQPLDVWHLSEQLSAPTLNQAFIESSPPVSRVVQVPSEPHFLFDSWIKFIAARPMPVFGVPGLIDHF